jgi:hypothetical protein
MLVFYEKHAIHPAVDKIFLFEESDLAMKYLFSGGHLGKWLFG